MLEPQFFHTHLYVWCAVSTVYIAGVTDDRRGMTPRIKLLILGLAALLAAFDGFVIDHTGIYAGYDVHLGMFSVPFTLFAVIGFANAYNMIDGLDGLAASVGIVILAAVWWLGFVHHDTFLMHASLLLATVMAAFLYYNRPPAKVFMGDSGSLTVGFLIAVLSIAALRYISGAAVLFLAAVPLLDTFYVMLRRKREGKSLTRADRCHIHHILYRYFEGKSSKVVTGMVFVQIALSAFAVTLAPHIDGLVLLIVFAVVFAIVYRLIEGIKKRNGIAC
jgi:UDP-GlcNAc:undecaprenyl-phosphate GlcNAc-1-phosphate transferase